MSPDLLAGVVCAVPTAALAAAGPAVIRRLPEPAKPDIDAVADTEAYARGAAPSRVPYCELADSPGLAWQLGATAAAVGAVAGAFLGVVPALMPWTYLAAVGVVLGYVDIKTRLLPTRILAPSYAVLAALLAAAALLDASFAGLTRAALGWLLMGGFYVVLWLVHPAGIGYGDVRLAGLLSLSLAYLGWGQLLVGIYAGFLLGGVGGGLMALAGLVNHRRYPFGPFMLLGALVGLVIGGPLSGWYIAR